MPLRHMIPAEIGSRYIF